MSQRSEQALPRHAGSALLTQSPSMCPTSGDPPALPSSLHPTCTHQASPAVAASRDPVSGCDTLEAP